MSICTSYTRFRQALSNHPVITRWSIGALMEVSRAQMYVLSRWDFRKVDVQGIDNHQMNNLQIATVGAVMNTQHGEVIGIFHQYAYTGQGTTIHSSGQLEWNGNKVSDTSTVVGGDQRILTSCGTIVPIAIKSGLPRVKLRPYTDKEWESLPHVIMTHEADWDPSVLDNEYDDDASWMNRMIDMSDDNREPSDYDEFGDYRHRVVRMSEVQEHSYDQMSDVVDTTCVYMSDLRRNSEPECLVDQDDNMLDIL